MMKKKGYTLFNLLGLAIGITCCLLIFQYVAYERSYDTFHKKAAQLVRLRLDLHNQGKLTMQSATAFPGLGTLLKKDLPEIQDYCRLIDTRISWDHGEMVQNNVVFSNDRDHIKSLENKGYYADPSFPYMFTLALKEGDKASLLNGPGKIALSVHTAEKYFGKEDPLGKKIMVREGGNTYYYEVTGVFENYPANSHLAFDYLISYATFVNKVRDLGAPRDLDPETSLGWYDFYDYLQLEPGTNLESFNAKLVSFCDRYLNTEASRGDNSREDLYAMPVQDIHLYSHYNEEASSGGDGKAVSFLFLIAFLIIAIAWINYTNLATARSLERAREVGVRKVLGAVRRNLLFQFLTESFLLNLAAAGIAVALAFLITPSFNSMVGSSSPYGFYLPASYQAGFLCLFVCGTFLSGIYAAFVLSGFRPVAVLNGRFKNSRGGTATRKALIIGQFAASIILISGTIIIYQQVDFMRNQELGADISQTLVLNGPSEKQDAAYQDAYKPFKNDILQVNGVKSITASSGVMGKEIYMTNEAFLASAGEKKHMTFYTLYVDADFLSSYGMRFIAGRNFTEQNPSDRKAVVLSEEAIHLLGIRNPREALGQILMNYQDSLKIIGVVANYHQMGLNKAMLPVAFVPSKGANNFYSIKFGTTDIHRTLASVEKVWNSYFPRDPFNYFFLDESFNAQYRSGERFGEVFGLFALIAIIIACFGLLSLSAYNVLQRTREIGIRKILGAPVSQIVFLLSKDFLVLVTIAFLLAIPVAWLVMNNWLSDYAYRIDISGWVFVAAGITGIFIALITIGFQAIKAARANPVKSLRSQ